MLDDTAVTTDSAPVTTDQPADTSQATTQPEQQNGGQNGSQFVPYARFQQVNQRMHQAEQRAAQFEARIAQLEQARQGTGQPASDEERALKDARDALYKVDPTLKELPSQLQQINGVITGLAQDRFVSSGERMIEAFAKQHSLEAPQLMQSFVQIIQSNPALMARAQKGDVGLVSEWLSGLQPVVAALKQQGQQAQREVTANTAQTKRALTTQVPPRPAGGQSGAVAPPKLDPVKDPTGREFMAQAHRDADAMLQNLRRNQG